MEASGSGQTVVRDGHSHPFLQRTGGPKMRQEKYYSSVAGDTSEASTTRSALGSIHESDGDAVRAWSDKPAYNW